MSIEGLEHFSKDQLVKELIERETFVGVVVFQRGDAKDGRLEPGETVVTKSPPLTREGVEYLLQVGQSLVPGMFNEQSPVAALPLHAVAPPLRMDEGGVVRVGNSRISLDLIVEQYDNGATPEDMVRAYDTLVLADVYATLGFYLRHRELVQAYLRSRVGEAEVLRAKIETERPRVSRDELLQRRNSIERDHAPAGQ